MIHHPGNILLPVTNLELGPTEAFPWRLNGTAGVEVRRGACCNQPRLRPQAAIPCIQAAPNVPCTCAVGGPCILLRGSAGRNFLLAGAAPERLLVGPGCRAVRVRWSAITAAVTAAGHADRARAATPLPAASILASVAAPPAPTPESAHEAATRRLGPGPHPWCASTSQRGLLGRRRLGQLNKVPLLPLLLGMPSVATAPYRPTQPPCGPGAHPHTPECSPFHSRARRAVHPAPGHPRDLPSSISLRSPP